MSLRIIEWGELILPSFKQSEASAMTIGAFDGVHRGHAELIRRVVLHGKQPTVVTFRENPKKLISSLKMEGPGSGEPDVSRPQRGFSEYPGDIYTLEQKLRVFKKLGIVQVILIDFSLDFSRMKGQEFINTLIDRGKLCFLVLGSNFRCGYRLDTGTALIKKMNEKRGIPTEIIPPLEHVTGAISSSRIRNLIAQGDLSLAAELLGRNFELDFFPKPALDREGLVFNFADGESPGRLFPPPGQYKALLRIPNTAGEQARERKLILEAWKAVIPFSNDFSPETIKDLKLDGGTTIEFLGGLNSP